MFGRPSNRTDRGLQGEPLNPRWPADRYVVRLTDFTRGFQVRTRKPSARTVSQMPTTGR